MKKVFLATATLIISLNIFAQFPGANGGKNQPPPAIGHIYGKLVDTTGKPVADASVVLLQNKFDSATKKTKQVLYKGGATKANGEFDFSDLPLFGITMKITAVGYKPYEEKISFQPKANGGSAAPSNNPAGQMASMMGNFDKDLGNIKLQSDANQLQNVTVSTSVSALKMDIDKKTFNVDKNIVSSGGTALDVMKNVPSVQVDIDGNVKLRNAAPQIYVDGRPTTLSLDQIPADAIQSVEVITNPSAKYDASGGNAGILNIVLKKNKKTGYNGNLMAGVDSHGGLNGGGNFSVRQGKINLNAAVMANQRHDRTNGTTDRLDFGDTLTHIYQENTSKTNGAFIFGKLGLDYFVTNRTTLSLSGIRVHGQFKPTDVFDKTTTSVFDSGQINSLSVGNSNNTRIFNANGLQFGMVHNFAKKDEQLTADGNYFSGKNEGSALYTTNYYDAIGNHTGNSVQQQLSNGNNQFFTVQTDYTNPLSQKTKLETGLRMQINEIENNNQTYNQAADGEFTKIPGTANNYTNSNKVYAAYATVTSSIKNFGYEVGLRAESSNYHGELTNTGEKFSNSYPISLFPSVFLSQKLKNRQELQLNFSRRINRPNFFQLIPYTDYSDSLNITRGNPNLVPEFTNSIEFSYSKTYKKNNNLLASIYYKHTNDLITRYQDTAYNAASGKTDLINSYINATSAYSYGAEFTSVNYVNKWWDFTLNVNLYKSKINTDNVSQLQQDAMLSWFSKFNNNFKLPANFSIQLSTSYQSKTNLPVNTGGQQFGPPSQAQAASQGYIEPFWVADIAIKKTFLKNNAAAVTLSMSDIFRSRVNEQVSFNQFFYQDYYRLSNPQLVRLNFTYRFGKMDISLFKRQSKGQGEGAQEATQMGGTR